jgi:ribosome biogenesis protein SSF1/2
MYPSIDVENIQLKDARRVVLFHYRKDDDKVEMRHYAIRSSNVGVSKQVRSLLKGKLPKLGELEDVSQYIDGGVGLAGLSDSEAEDEGAQLDLPQRNTKRGHERMQQSALKLSEIGPRITLELFKVEKDVCEGDILYHKFVTKSEEEARKTKQRLEAAASLKAQRRATQEENVKRKREDVEKKREEKRAKYAKRAEEGAGDANASESSSEEEDEDDREA